MNESTIYLLLRKFKCGLHTKEPNFDRHIPKYLNEPVVRSEAYI